MQQIKQNQAITPYQTGESRMVQVGDRVYSIVEIQPTAIQPTAPGTIPTPYHNGFWDALLWLGVGSGFILLFGLSAYGLTRAFLVPTPATPVAAPTPQTIIIQPPPQVEKKPFARRECRADGLFGWGESCTEEKGYE
jgi:hypothetical protein